MHNLLNLSICGIACGKIFINAHLSKRYQQDQGYVENGYKYTQDSLQQTCRVYCHKNRHIQNKSMPFYMQ